LDGPNRSRLGDACGMAGLTGELAEAGRLERDGKFDAAEALYLRLLKRRPNDVAALNLLGLLCHRRGQHEEAAKLIHRALAFKPNDAEALGNLGAVQVALGNLPLAIASFRRATALASHSAAAWANLGNALMDSADTANALEAYRRALALKPRWPGLQRQLARAHYILGEFEHAAQAYAKAAADDPDDANSWNDLGAARHHLGDLTAATSALREAIRLNPDHAAAWRNLGAVENDSANDEAAIACFDRAIALDLHNADAHVFRGICLLRSKRFTEGWAEYEWRLARQQARHAQARYDRPTWKGENFTGRRILIHAEQGFGDTIQFMRYLPLVRARGGEVLFEIQEPLKGLIAASPLAADISVIVQGSERPPFDIHCPLLSLPAIFGTNLANIPTSMPYLFADPSAMPCLPPRRQDRRCAIVWSGNLANAAGRNRSMPGTTFDRLAGLQNIEFVSLQIDPATRPQMLSLIDAAPLLEDFASTAAVLRDTDLVVTVDTAVAHLAGAMGKPGWVLLSYAADWRWLNGREDSPWYPSLRLFRQSRPGDWESVMRRVAERLAQDG
jgi:Flp pilus assembly protein TadD